MAHELAPYPASMFDESGKMRDAKSKSNLKNALKVEASSRNVHIDAAFLDGCAVLWTVHWPTGGTVQDLFFLETFETLSRAKYCE
jgi:hypothetical protein